MRPTAARTSPPNPDEDRIIHEAMAGLRYDSGVAEIDAELAPQIVSDPDPSRVDAELAAGFAAVERGRIGIPDAIRAFTRAAIHDPSHGPTFNALGATLVSAGQTAAGAAASRAVLRADPANSEALTRLAVAAQMLGDFPEAIECWTAILRNQPSETARERLAVLFYFAERYADSWAMIHEAEALGQRVPPQLRDRLREAMPEADR